MPFGLPEDGAKNEGEREGGLIIACVRTPRSLGRVHADVASTTHAYMVYVGTTLLCMYEYFSVGIKGERRGLSSRIVVNFLRISIFI